MILDHVISIRNYSIRVEHLLLLIVGSLAALLLFSNLDDQVLWQDEAQTATIAKTILQFGVPKGYDGKNFFSQEYGAEYGEEYVWKWHTWLSFYVVAASFTVLGETTFAARFPFALFGIATVALSYYAAYSLFRNKRTAFLTALLLLLTVPFLILSRQSRYYSLSMFFSLLGLVAYDGILKEKKFAPTTFVVASTLLFHAHYIYFATLLATIAAHAFLFHREKLRALLAPVLLSFLINLPWIIWISTFNYSERYGENLFSLEQVERFGRNYIFQISRFLFPPMLVLILFLSIGARWWKEHYLNADTLSMRKKIGWLLALMATFLVGSWVLPWIYFYFFLSVLLASLVIAFIHRSNEWQNAGLLVLFILANLSALLLSVPFAFFRYLAPVVPLFSILTAVIIERTVKFHPLIAVMIIVWLLAGNPLLKDYLDELRHEYVGPMQGIVQYLQTHGSENDTVLITYEDLPLKFYTSMKVVGGLTGENLAPYTAPHWIILRKYSVGLQDSTIRRHVWTNIDMNNYEKISIPYPDIPFQNREEPRDHHFTTVRDADSIYIFHKNR